MVSSAVIVAVKYTTRTERDFTQPQSDKKTLPHCPCFSNQADIIKILQRQQICIAKYHFITSHEEYVRDSYPQYNIFSITDMIEILQREYILMHCPTSFHTSHERYIRDSYPQHIIVSSMELIEILQHKYILMHCPISFHIFS